MLNMIILKRYAITREERETRQVRNICFGREHSERNIRYSAELYVSSYFLVNR